MQSVGSSASARPARGVAQQRLSAARQCHHARGKWFGQALDFDRLCALRHVGGGGLAQLHVADVQPDPRRHAQRRQHSVIVERVASRVCGAVEKQEEAVRTIDLAAVMAAQRCAGAAVVLDPEHLVARASPRRCVSSVLSTTSENRRVCTPRATVADRGRPRSVSELAAHSAEEIASPGASTRVRRDHPAGCPTDPGRAGRARAGIRSVATARAPDRPPVPESLPGMSEASSLGEERQPRRAASIAAMSIFFISIIASNARLAAARSGSASGSQGARRDLPRQAPLVLAPAACAFLAAIADDRVPQAVGFGLVVGRDLEREGLVVLEPGAAVQPEAGDAHHGESTVKTSPCLPEG